LLELLLAASLSLLVMHLTFSAIAQGLTYWKEEQARFLAWQQASMLLSTLDRDLRNCARPEFSSVPIAFQGTSAQLRFMVCNTSFPDEAAFLEMEYALLPARPGETGMSVHRRLRNGAGAVLAQNEYAGIGELSLRYLTRDGQATGPWEAQWSGSFGEVPRAVEAQIKLRGRSPVGLHTSLSLLVAIPAGGKR
jgi:hypothetical protein